MPVPSVLDPIQSIHPIFLVHQNIGDPPCDFGVDVDLGRLDAAVAARKTFGQAGRPQLQPRVIASASDRENG